MNMRVVLSYFPPLMYVSEQVVAALRRAREKCLIRLSLFLLRGGLQKRWDVVLLADALALESSINTADGLSCKAVLLRCKTAGAVAPDVPSLALPTSPPNPEYESSFVS
jgi:hypothetical protein